MLSAQADGSLRGGSAAVEALRLPLNSTRLQGQVGVTGIDELFVWGSGAVGALVFEPPLTEATAVTARPNSVTYRMPGGSVTITALPVKPAVVVEFNGVPGVVRLAPSRSTQPGLPGRFTLTAVTDGWVARSPWATAVLRGADAEVGRNGRLHMSAASVAVLALGDGAEEAETAAAAVLRAPDEALRAAHGYAGSLENALEVDDALLKALFTACLHAAHSSRKELTGGTFAGFSAGTGYVMPPRTYYRDAYWTLQALLPFRPAAAIEQVRLLAAGVADDGEAPSGVIVASAAGRQVWEARVAAEPALAADHARPGQWWSDHFDSPYYFVLLARDALRWSIGSEAGSRSPTERTARLAAAVEEPVGGVSLAIRIVAVLERGRRLAGTGHLPIKPVNDRDWADNVFRHGFVTYDVALYHGALLAGAELLAGSRPAAAAAYKATAADVRRAATDHLYLADEGHFAEFRPAPQRGGANRTPQGETHITLDSLVSIRTGLASAAQAEASLAAAGRILETRNNHEQPYGDWGVMSTYPPYAATTRRRAKSSFAYRYHNGSDWPYLDGIYAEALLARGHPGWRYPLTRWFEYGLAQGWPTPVEYYAPPWGRGSPLNGWSAMPAAAMLLGGFGLTPTGAPRVPPWGDCALNGVLIGGSEARLTVTDGEVLTVPTNGVHARDAHG